MNKISGQEQEERREEKRREEKKKKQKREDERDQPEEISGQEEDTLPAWFMEYMENYKDKVAAEITTKVVHLLSIIIENKLVLNVQPL